MKLSKIDYILIFLLIVVIAITEHYTNLILGDIKEYDCTSGYRESRVTVQWKSSDVLFNNPLIITVNQSVNNTRYACIITVDGNPDICKAQTKDILFTVRGRSELNYFKLSFDFAVRYFCEK